MGEEQVQDSLTIQKAIAARLAELAFANSEQAQRISRQMAEVATRGKRFADDILPLFLQLPRENEASIAKVALAIKLQLEELTDTLVDLRDDLRDWAEFFYPAQGH